MFTKSGIHFGIQNEINMYKNLKNHMFLNMKWYEKICKNAYKNYIWIEMDLDYVEALEYGLPPTDGMGMGW